ncbi:MAG: transposase [Acidobacteria bacterium]|nr:transposase [Acidobacteriota bacterium]
MKQKQLTLMDAMLTLSRRKKTSRGGTWSRSASWWTGKHWLRSSSSWTGREDGAGGRRCRSRSAEELFLQHAFNLSDEELEDQLADRLSFQQFVGLGYDEEIPDFTTFWKFKEKLVKAGLMQKIFEQILSQIDERGLILKRGTIIDATLIQSANRPMTKEKREKAKESRQLDADAAGTSQGGKKHFGYKGPHRRTRAARSSASAN